MLARRRRMLEVAKQLIAEGGHDGFTIRDLSRRAKVSVTTIYAAFGDKLGVIAAALEDYYEDLDIAHTPRTTSLTALLGSKDQVRDAILSNKPYARRYAELYYSHSTDPRIYKAIRAISITAGGHLPWLQKTMRDGDVVPGLTIDYVNDLLANGRLTMLHDWANGRISDDGLGLAIKKTFLLLARAVTCGATHARVDAELRRLLRMSSIDQ